MSDSVEHHMEIAFRPGVFVPDRVCFSFVSDLEQVAAEIARLVEAEPARACKLYELFLAACQQKADELDDSSASFAMFVSDLACAWIRARQAADADPDKTARKLLAWIDNDKYGFFSGIEGPVAQAFDTSGLAAFENLVRLRFEADHRHWGAVLKAIYRHQKNIAAYVALAEQNGLTAEDCHSIATLIAAEDKTEEALAWIERGLANARPGTEYDLVKLQRELWIRLGRVQQALEAAWNDFRKFPGKYRYDELMKYVAEADRAVWHQKAMEAATGADLAALIELFVETNELDRFTDLIRGTNDETLEHTSHYATEPAAEKLTETQPALAARLWRSQGMRIVNKGKSKYYDAAVGNFERAKACYERAGLPAEWEQTVRCVRERHSRKTGFMPGFERVVAGSHRTCVPSFLDLARSRWGTTDDL